MNRFVDRSHAGRILASRLSRYGGRLDVVVLALPRGGVPVGFEVARELGLPLDVFVVRKLGVPGREELAMGAIASGGVRILNADVVDGLGIPDSTIDEVTAAEARELERRERQYRSGLPPLDVGGRAVIVVDDGLATGATMRAAVAALESRNASRIVVAVPVGPADTCRELRHLADEVICLYMPQSFYGVGAWYQDFQQTTDEDVRTALTEAPPRHRDEAARP